MPSAFSFGEHPIFMPQLCCGAQAEVEYQNTSSKRLPSWNKTDLLLDLTINFVDLPPWVNGFPY